MSPRADSHLEFSTCQISVLSLTLLNPYKNPVRWIILLSPFTDGKLRCIEVNYFLRSQTWSRDLSLGSLTLEPMF